MQGITIDFKDLTKIGAFINTFAFVLGKLMGHICENSHQMSISLKSIYY